MPMSVPPAADESRTVSVLAGWLASSDERHLNACHQKALTLVGMMKQLGWTLPPDAAADEA